MIIAVWYGQWKFFCKVEKSMNKFTFFLKKIDFWHILKHILINIRDIAKTKIYLEIAIKTQWNGIFLKLITCKICVIHLVFKYLVEKNKLVIAKKLFLKFFLGFLESALLN